MARVFAACALVTSLSAGVWLFLHHVTLSGPGDQLSYYAQAERLIPFTNHWYGPGYFVALRIVHDLFGTDWLTAGKTIGFASTLGILAVCWNLFRRLLDPALAWMALGIVALLPDLIHQMYSDLTIPLGAFWVLAAITTTVGARLEDTRKWILAGALFGVGALVRFQTFGFLLGAIVGTFLVKGTWVQRMRSATIMLVTAIVPTVAWRLFLVSVQGSSPQNWNFIALTMATGEFQSFLQIDDMVQKYGSFWGLMKSDRLLIPRLVASSLEQTVRFPTDVGSRMLGPAVLWLGPGVVSGIFDRVFWSPWAVALVAGFLITAPTQQGWTHYFVPILPLLVLILIWGVEIADRKVRPRVVAAGWIALVAGVLVWAVHRVPRDFELDEWTELRVAIDYLNRGAAEKKLVSSTSYAVVYGAKFRFVRFARIWGGRDDLEFVDALRAAGVTHLIVTERHTVPGYPSQGELLADSVRRMPAGLVRDTLIVTPRRLAILSVQP